MILRCKNFYAYWSSRDIRRAIKFGTHVTPCELQILSDLASSCKTGIEIGSYLGASSYIIAKALGSNFSDQDSSLLACVDTWQNHAMSEGSRDTFQTFLDNTHEVEKVTVPIRGFSEDVIAQVKKTVKGKVDFLFIDANHDYEGVKSDWDNYKRFLQSSSIVAFHDYGWAEGVKEVVDYDVRPLLKDAYARGNLFWGVMK